MGVGYKHIHTLTPIFERIKQQQNMEKYDFHNKSLNFFVK